ncbi:peptidoglycan-binding domain-containing protein [Mesorhizobium amorphae]|uniref:peptidoglycan-binding domain-containing protein n=1 Tax=Mesorhizobium amorphae TaxID=71433 RepID=UPI001186D9B7|nr:peptidoglycan-binding domain-containing protein [Mesorhizobium amorphae]
MTNAPAGAATSAAIRSWRLAKSLMVLRDQINALSPNRSKVADGTLGDTAHSKRKSDHNPNVRGVVQALDLTDDPAHGVDNRKLAQALLDSRDRRIKYVIADGEICSGAGGPSPWVWRPYTGTNAHRHHVHISVADDPKLYDDASAWSLPGFNVPPSKAEKPVTKPVNPVLVKGNKGPDVERLQKLLVANGAKLVVDADFGDRTEKAVRSFQKAARITVDGKVGAQTWEGLLS